MKASLLFITLVTSSLSLTQASECLSKYNAGEAFLYKNQCYYKDFNLETCSKDDQSIKIGEDCFLPENRIQKSTPKNSKKGEPQNIMEDIRIVSSLGVEVSLLLKNQLRASGGNETSVGDHFISADALILQDVKGKKLKTLFIDISLRNRDAVLDYQVKAEQNFHNSNRFRADGYLDRPDLLASIGADFQVSDTQEFKVSMGSMALNGLDPIKGKASQYYATNPYNLIIRYGQGLKIDYTLKSKVAEIVKASFSIDDGDTVKGQPHITPSDSRANSYPSFGHSAELEVFSLFKHFQQIDQNAPEKHQLYIGYTGSHADTGSSPGQKRLEDDSIVYVGLRERLSFGNFEFRTAYSSFTRNNINDGLGRSGGNYQVITGSSLEMSLTDIKLRSCNLNLYGNRYRLHSNALVPDGEFLWGNVREVKGYTLGAKCNDLGGYKGASLGVEYGKRHVNDPKSIGESWSIIDGIDHGTQFNLIFGLRKDFIK